MTKRSSPEENIHFTGSTSHRKSSWGEKIKHSLEILLGYVFIHLPYRYLGRFYVRFMAWFLGFVGPLLWVHKRVVDHLNLALPELCELEKKIIAKQSWQNIAYIPYDFIMAKYKPQTLKIDIIGIEHLHQLQESQKNALFFSGHNACWEIFRIAAHQHHINSAIIYRPFNNALFDHYARNLMDHGFAPIFQKNPAGIRKMLKHLRGDNQHILMLTDQRLSGGISVPFFNHPALTAPSAAELAMRYKMPLMPIFVTRIDIGHYKIIIHPAIETQNQTLDTVLTDMNKHIENHIRHYPSQWFWLHRRWK
ncbi:MAG: KDO2-lipid IV(A) lauroyltransferase [Alphaproteobacteria bacterium]|jgi:KDO2-lipid IV(A) lauroyltransferase